MVDNGQEKWIDASTAEAAGYTLIDLSDDFTPFIFAEQMDAEGKVMPNRYRRVFLGLANDQVDEDGQPLAPGEKNYLELYGIFPSLSVLRKPVHGGRRADLPGREQPGRAGGGADRGLHPARGRAPG